MAAHSYSGQLGFAGQNVITMPDPKFAAIAKCLELAQVLADRCPNAATTCAELSFWLNTVNGAMLLGGESRGETVSLSGSKGWYESLMKYLRAFPEEDHTEGGIFDELMRLKAPGWDLSDPKGNYRRAVKVAEKVKKSIEVVESGTGDRDDNVIRLRDTAKIPPKSVKP